MFRPQLPAKTPPRHPTQRGSTARQGRRLNVMTHNVGLHHTCVADVLLLQERHWSFTNLFDVPKYCVIHAGAADHRLQGCAILIRKTLAEVTALHWAPILARHLLHVRFPLQGKHVDVLCGYQFSWSFVGGRGSLERQWVWIQLDTTIAGLPRRNVLILGGDVNTSARPLHSNFGPTVPQPCGIPFTASS